MKLLINFLSLSLLLLTGECANSEEATKVPELKLRQVPMDEAIEFYAKEKSVEIRYDKKDTKGKFAENLRFISFFTWQGGLNHILAPHHMELIKDIKNENLYYVKPKALSN